MNAIAIFPAIRGTSYLSPQLRAGHDRRTDVRRGRVCRAKLQGSATARAGIETWISQLVWRDFYQMILKQFPHVDGEPFIASAARLSWNAPGANFEAWCGGKTGYPLVDAAMRQLNSYGWMHNRLRMIVASFLSKHLLIDWRKGERYFEQHLADADLAENNGGWQWAASTGTDAAPYFRIFNPVLQSERFDPDGAFIKRHASGASSRPGRLHSRAVEDAADLAEEPEHRDRCPVSESDRRSCISPGPRNSRL